MTAYWNRIAADRLSRRRLLRTGAFAGGGLAALGLFGCGGGSSGGSSSSNGSPSAASGDKSGLLTKPVDTTSKAVQGGVFQTSVAGDPLTFDVISGSALDVPHAGRVYSRLVKYDVFKYPDPVQANVVADAATSWETSPDGLTVTYKMRPNFKLDPRAPTNGRPLTAADAKFSFDRFFKLSPQRATLANSVDPTAPIASTEAPDDSTFVLKLAFPYAPLNIILAAYRYVVIMPQEADSKFDIRNNMYGTGAWRLTESARSNHFSYERNPDWYDAAKVHLNGQNFPVIPEAATNMAQFRTGALWTYGVSQDQVLDTKQSAPSMIMQPQEDFSAGGNWIRFGYLPGSPFLDERVRKAVSMSLDRDTFVNAFGNVDVFNKAGLDVPARWNSSIFAGDQGFWIDPKDDKTFGDSAKFYKFDPATAKQMLTAAGQSVPLPFKWSYSVGFFGPVTDKKMEVLQGMWQDSGNFKVTANTLNYATDFGPKYTNGEDKWDGLASAATAARPEVDVLLHEYYKTGSPRAGQLGPDGKPDAALNDMIDKQRAENDPKRRAALIGDIQRYISSKMYAIMEPGQALGFNLAWPWLQNFGLYRSRSGGSPDQEGNVYYWYDQTKKT